MTINVEDSSVGSLQTFEFPMPTPADPDFDPVRFELLTDLRLLGLSLSRFDSVYNRFLFSGLTLKNAGDFKLDMQILDIDYYTFAFSVKLKVNVFEPDPETLKKRAAEQAKKNAEKARIKAEQEAYVLNALLPKLFSNKTTATESAEYPLNLNATFFSPNGALELLFSDKIRPLESYFQFIN